MPEKKFDAKAEASVIEAFFARQELATAPAWRPGPGETIMGEVIGFQVGTPSDPKLKQYPIVILRSASEGTRALHCFHTLLADGFKEIDVQIGMRVAVSFLGVKLKNDAVDKPEAELESTDSYYHYFVANLDALDAPIGRSTFGVN